MAKKKKKTFRHASLQRAPARRRPIKRSKAKRVARQKISVATQRSTRRSITPRLVLSKKAAIERLRAHRTGFGAINYGMLENEIHRLTDLLQTISKKSTLVKEALAYLDREQKKVARQIHEAKKFLLKLKNRGLKALREFPDSAEDILFQLRNDINRLSKRLGLRPIFH